MHVQCTLIARIPLYRRDGTVAAYTLVDWEQAIHLAQWRWFLSNGYACRREGGANIRMHRMLLGLDGRGRDPSADHINRDRLDNRQANLRVTTHAENMQNRGSNRGATSRYRGVCWDAYNQRWKASVGLNGKYYQLGNFRDEDEAGAAAKAWRDQHMPFSTD